MLDKTLKWLLPITIIITIAQTLYPNGLFSFLNPFSMIITSLMFYSIGWVASGSVYNETNQDYSIVRRVGLATVFTMPMIAIVFSPSFLYPYIVGKAFVFRFSIIIALCSFFYLSFTNESHRPRVTPFVLSFTVFVFIVGLSAIFSIDPSRSFWGNYERMEGYINLLCLFILAISVTTFRIREVEWDKIFAVHLWVSGIVSIVAISQKLVYMVGITKLSNTAVIGLCFTQGDACRVDSFLGNPIYLGIYSAMTFWMIIYAIFAKKVKGDILPILAGINLLAVYFSGTRGVWLGMALGFVVLVLSKYWFDGNRKAVVGTLLSAALFLSLLTGFVIYAKKNNIAQDVEVVARLSSVNTLFARWNIWKTAVVSWEQKPIIGWGEENFIHAFNLNYNPAMYGQETFFDHPHNTYLGWLVFGGLLGFLSFLFWVGMAIYGMVKSHLMQEKINDLVIPILLALTTTYLVHIFFVFDNLTSSLLFVLVCIYFGHFHSYGVLNLQIVNNKYKDIFRYVLIFVGLFLVYKVIYLPSYANLLVIDAMTLQQTARSLEDLKEVQKKYEQAIGLNTFGTYEIREFFLQRSLDLVNAAVKTDDQNVKAEVISFANSALLQFQKQIDNNPSDHRAKFMLGLYYLQTQNYDLAVQVLTKSLELAPNKQIALVYLAKAYALKDDMATAFKYYEQAINITPKDIVGYNQIRIEYIQLLMLAKQDDKALEVIKELLPTATREDFDLLIAQMTQVYDQRKDMKGVIKLLSDANHLDPQNQNFVLWLAQAYVASGDYNSAVFTINKLSVINPSVVAQFTQELDNYMKQSQKKVVSQTENDTKKATKTQSK